MYEHCTPSGDSIERQHIYPSPKSANRLAVLVSCLACMWDRGYPTNCTAIPVTGRAGVWGCETSRIPLCLDSRLTDGCEASLMCWLRFNPSGRFVVLISVSD
jgi:hypothetical protein